MAFWAISSNLPVKILAAIGGFALGGMVLAWLVQMGVGLVFHQKLPAWMAWGLRVLGGVAMAMFVWALMSGGQLGWGGPGGFVGGSGKGGSEGTEKQVVRDKSKDSQEVSDKSDTKDKSGTKTASPAAPPLRVEVLGDEPLKKLGKGEFDPAKRYRLEDGQNDLKTLVELQQIIRARRKQDPPLRALVIVIYRDSPDRDKDQVASLARWAEEVSADGQGKLAVDFNEPGRYAPIE